MKNFFGICLAICFANSAWADDSLGSELKHVAVGAVVAGVATVVADRFWPENRAWIGFAAGVTAGVLGELVDRGQGSGKWDGKHSALDVAATAVGAGIGAFVTDRFILMPVVKRAHGGQYQYYGVAGQYRF